MAQPPKGGLVTGHDKSIHGGPPAIYFHYGVIKNRSFLSSWWIQPIWKTLYSQIGSFPQVGVHIKTPWNHHLDFIVWFHCFKDRFRHRWVHPTWQARCIATTWQVCWWFQATPLSKWVLIFPQINRGENSEKYLKKKHHTNDHWNWNCFRLLGMIGKGIGIAIGRYDCK